MRKIILILSILIFANASEELFSKNEFKKAYKNFKKECSNNIANSCYRLGQMNEYALGTKKSYEYAYKYYEKSCDLGDLNACTALGKLYSLGLGVSKDINKANAMFKNACDNDIYEACDNYAYIQKTEFNIIKDEELLKACQGGVAHSCYELANHVETNYKTKFYLKACSLNDEYSCKKIAETFTISNNNLDDIRNFSKLSRAECENKNKTACKALGDIYKNLKDYELATIFYEKACNLNELESCANLGNIYYELKDFNKSLLNFTKSCDELNHGYSCYKLGILHKTGLENIINADIKKANLYFEKACELGYTKACEY